MISASFGGISGFETHRRNRLLFQNAGEDDGVCVAAERERAGGHLVEHRAKAEKIAAGIERLAARLLGRHVGHRAERRAGAGEMGGFQGGLGVAGQGGGGALAVALNLLGQAEIEDFGVAAGGDEDVGRLDVAMDDALFVRGVERVGDFDAERQQQSERQGLFRDAVLEGLALQKLHRDEIAAVVLGNVVNRADARMIQRGSGAGFAPETLEGVGIALQFRREEFQGHAAAQIQILSDVDHTHSATTEPVDDAVVRDGLADQWGGFSHAGSILWRGQRQVNGGHRSPAGTSLGMGVGTRPCMRLPWFSRGSRAGSADTRAMFAGCCREAGGEKEGTRGNVPLRGARDVRDQFAGRGGPCPCHDTNNIAGERFGLAGAGLKPAPTTRGQGGGTARRDLSLAWRARFG